MMIKRLLKIYALLSLLTFVNLVGLKAQTHADATSQKWKGIDVNTVLGNSDYTDTANPDHDTVAEALRVVPSHRSLTY